MALRTARDALSRIFYQRCFYLFALLLLLIALVPFLPYNDQGRIALNWVNAFVVLGTVAAVGRSPMSFLGAVLLATPALLFQWIGVMQDDRLYLAYGWAFSAVLYFMTTGYLLRYVFQPEVMTADKLFGAAAAYLMIGVLWAYFYALVGFFYPDSFMVLGTAATLGYQDALYFSMTVLTSTGFGDISPLSRQARGVCIIEQLTGALFVAILIARLAGVYPPNRPK